MANLYLSMKQLAKIVGWIFVVIITCTLILYGVLFSYKKEILAAVNKKIGESINGEVKIGDLNITLFHDFPNISLSLRDIYLRGPKYDIYKKDFLRAEVVNVNVELINLLRRQVKIQSIDVINGDVFAFRTKDGFLNLEIFNKITRKDTVNSTQHEPSLSFEKMSFTNVSLSFHDSLNAKLFGLRFNRVENTMVSTDSSVHAHIIGSIDFAGLTFNTDKGSFLENKQTGADLNVQFFFPSSRLVIEPSFLTLEKSIIQVSGAMHFLLPGGNFQIHIQSDQVDYGEGLIVVTKNMRERLSKFAIEKPVAIHVMVNGKFGSSTPPAADGTFAIADSHIEWKGHELQNAFVQGSFSNHKHDSLAYDDVNTEIKLDSVKGVFKSLPFKGAVSFNDLTNPLLNLAMVFDADLKNINADLDTTQLRFTEGHFITKVLYQGKPSEYFDGAVTKFSGKLQGETNVKDGRLAFMTKEITLDRIQASFKFTEKKFDIEKITLRLNKNAIQLNGSITGFIPFFLLPEKQGNVFLNVHSPSLDLTGLSSGPAKSNFDVKTARNKKKISDAIDQLYKKLAFEIVFQVDKIKSKDILGTGLSGKFILANNRLEAQAVKMNMAKGQLEFSATLDDLQRDVNPFTLKADVRNADIKEFFYMFHNFQQNTIRSEHIDGKLFAAVDVTAGINDNFEVLMDQLNGNVNFNVVDGRIRNFEPLENMSNFLMKNRDFTDVQFGEIKANFDIHGSELDISRMEVQSTVLTLFLEGRYSLKDSTNLNIQVPLSNLKKRNQNYAPENVGTDAKIGMSVRLRAYQGKDGKTVIAFAPFSKSPKAKRN